MILYELLFEKKPFSAERNIQLSLYEQIRTADYVFPPKSELISSEALDLVQKLLTVEPSRRLSRGEGGTPWCPGLPSVTNRPGLW